MKPLSNIESRRLERMWRAETFNEQKAKDHTEALVQDVLRKAEKKFQAAKAKPIPFR